jgi:pathogenesis-related protein 1
MRTLLLAGMLVTAGLPPARAQAPFPPAPRTGAATGSALTWAEVRTLLALHNQVRAEVGVPPLTWSPEVAAWAQAWADHLASQGCAFEHRPDNPYGENLFGGTAGGDGVGDAVKAWYQEKADYPGGPLSPDNWFKAGHYTQLVWRDTTKVGCGKAECNDQIIVVCDYDPAGNTMGQSPY